MAQTASAIDLPLPLQKLDYHKAFGLLVTYVLLLFAVTVILFPVFWMASSSLKPDTELFARNMTMLPINWSLPLMPCSQRTPRSLRILLEHASRYRLGHYVI